ncbi:ribosomal protein L7/L12 [Pleionea sediminis]|uniref:ribosomal protein L7/L12 n=1 Tax=Pleionea sediminis TaxID=2569479 RepID=UPI0011862CEF|nr:ribosomal protein L7/L12 [Pleionea sediminis]
MSNTYNVVITGQIIDGHNIENVINGVAKTFKLSLEKASALFQGNKKTIKKSTDQKTAHKFKAALEKLGAVVEIESVNAVKHSLTLEPIESKSNQNEVIENNEVVENANYHDDETTVAYESLNFISIITALGVAGIGSFLWLQIAIAFELEIGWIAWIIGGAIGLSVITTDSHGTGAGIFSGICALLSITWGQYLVYDHFSYGLVPTFELMKQEFDFISAIFLILGVSTAYKLASGFDES